MSACALISCCLRQQKTEKHREKFLVQRVGFVCNGREKRYCAVVVMTSPRRCVAYCCRDAKTLFFDES